MQNNTSFSQLERTAIIVMVVILSGVIAQVLLKDKKATTNDPSGRVAPQEVVSNA